MQRNCVTVFAEKESLFYSTIFDHLGGVVENLKREMLSPTSKNAIDFPTIRIFMKLPRFAGFFHVSARFFGGKMF